jgi:hypothetical protein
MLQCKMFRAFRHSLSVTDLTAHLRSGTAKRKDSAMAFAYHRRARERDRFERKNDAPAITADNPAHYACCLTPIRNSRAKADAESPTRTYFRIGVNSSRRGLPRPAQTPCGDTDQGDDGGSKSSRRCCRRKLRPEYLYHVSSGVVRRV